MAAWGMGDYRAKGQWRKQLRAFLGGKGALRPLQAVFKYFGSKLAFYQAFMAHLGRTLVLLAGAGILCFGILWVPLRPESDLDGSVSVSITYDHPIAYIFFGLAVVWAAVLVRTWAKKEAELRYRWRLDTIRDYPKTPSPQSTAVVKRLYVNNSWQYVPVATPAMLKARLGWIGTSIFLWLAFVTASVFSTWALVDVLVTDVIDETRSLHDNFDNPLEKDRNIVGTIALYGATAANAVAIYVLNAVWERVAVWLTYRENYGTVYEHDTALAIKLLSYQFVNSTLSLFYLAYYRKDFDKTAAMLAAIVVVGQLISLTLEYLFPWLSARNRGLNDEEAHAIAEVASQQQMLSHAGDDKESGGERPSTAGNKADDLAETGEATAPPGGRESGIETRQSAECARLLHCKLTWPRPSRTPLSWI